MEGGMVDQVRIRGERLARALQDAGFPVRGVGLLRAVTVGQGRALAVARGLLERGWLALPADDDALQLTPPVTLADTQIDGFCAALRELA
jgi:acetylornithine/succinyldiaminopimelate/putrescine aminotransferase